MNAVAMMPLHRHQLARLSDAGWRKVLKREWDAPARECLAHWAAQRLPLVVTRQDAHAGDGAIALGLPAPARWGRRRLALRVAPNDVLYFDEFELADRALDLLPVSTRPAWRSLCCSLKAAGANARVYGSYGWQLLSGLAYVHAGSDVDLWLSGSDADQADALAACLQSFSDRHPRLDGELMFDDGAAVAWREWLAWRAGRVKALLVKTIDGSSLVHTPGWQGATASTAAA
jgi:phosphoribosyl-dephospho-CoA transferase